MLETAEELDLDEFISVLRKDYSKLAIRIRELTHSVQCDCDGVTLRLHFPAINQGKATIWELINVILDYVTPFALHRTQIEELDKAYREVTPDEYRIKCERLQREALSLFIRAQKETNRNGEAGELILYLLTEWILKAPQLLAKLPLKTNRNVPVHGCDGIHVGFMPEGNTLCLYWGESKLYADVNKAIDEATRSIAKALRPENVEYELSLVTRNIDAVTLSQDAKSLILSFLDPFEHENYNRRITATTCLIGFDFDAYNELNPKSTESEFRVLANAKLQQLAPRLSSSLRSVGVKNHLIELFFFPVPSVQDLRDQFQAKIGWKNDSGPS
jgi:Cap4 SAVED domain